MKALVCWLLFFIVPIVCAAEELPWTPVNIPGLEITISGGYLPYHYGLWFHDDFGWLNAGKKLWITYDAGRSWIPSLVGPNNRGFYDAYFINPLEGWVVLESFPTILFRTRDGGKTWESMEVKLTRTSLEPAGAVYLTYIYFKDSMHGLGTFPVDGFPYPLAYLIARTDDGGEHWTEIRSGGGKIIGFGDQIRIGGASYSPDFGETFQRFSTPSELEPFFVTPLYGWAIDYFYVGESSPMPVRWDVLKTTDGGNTWSAPIFSKTTDRGFTGIRDICLFSENVGAVLWFGSSEADMPFLLYLTYNSGMSWLSYEIPVQSEYMLSCNVKRHEVWLVPSLYGIRSNILFYASIANLTAVKPSGKLTTSWGIIKNRKEF